MKKHLPECHFIDISYGRTLEGICICHALRACEQRMYDWSKSFGVGKTFYDAGRAAGLDAAREAVFAAVGPGADAFSIYVLGNALAAIDAVIVNAIIRARSTGLFEEKP